MAEETPLKQSDSASNEAIDYEAIFEGQGSKGHHKEFAQKTILGECRNPKRISWVEWVFMIVATLSLLGVLGLTIERLIHFEMDFLNLTYNTTTDAACDTWVCTNDFIFTILILVNIGFCTFYCYDGLLRERPFEILAYVVAVAVIMAYIIINFIIKGDEEQPLRTVRLALVCVFGPLNILFALLSWWKMGYLVLNVIGTNTSLIRAYRVRSFFQTAQFFHVELLCNVFVLAWAQQGQFLETWEKVIICLLLFYTVLVTAVGGVAVLWEQKLLAYIWYGLILPCGAYYLYKLVEVSVNFNRHDVKYTEYTRSSGETSVDLHYIGGGLLFACVVGVGVVTVLIVFMTLALLNFRKGLRDKIRPPLHRYLSRVQRPGLMNSSW